MSEFLNHLIARSGRSLAGTGEGRILQPRLPALFETPDGPGGLHAPAGEMDGSIEETAETSFERSGRENLPRRPFPAANEPPRGFFHPAEPTVAKAAGAQGPATRLPRIKGEGAGPVESETGEGYAVLPGVSAKRMQPVGSENAPGIGDQDRAPAGPRGGNEAEKPALDETHLIHPDVRVHAPGPQTPSLQSESMNPAVGQAAAPDAAGQPDRWSGPPTVRISIGRIEVRAVPSAPPPASRAPAPPRPKLTLDEYLRQRNEGKR